MYSGVKKISYKSQITKLKIQISLSELIFNLRNCFHLKFGIYLFVVWSLEYYFKVLFLKLNLNSMVALKRINSS